MNDTLASARHRPVRPETAVEPADVPRGHLATLRSMIDNWRERTRYRWELKQMSKDNPHLIDDIGLTRLQVEEEIAKLPFWQR
ncbi:DUF1127 domain-containing protein [Mesorhizobium sp. PAMC28654]|uniref:DUF1127 domain-containing protein n=1 Tax=Mesorhizobium sp. PAMC28654 TaxID=2880934 RepID=UPI001D0A2914|nr:DUF1127 domain-containing protein [Mesorhizobium sp. PAMC28654]UDL87648.1 DUF1127 domain-containing protein [Mesorhizobium sp. PAMC28654]